MAKDGTLDHNQSRQRLNKLYAGIGYFALNLGRYSFFRRFSLLFLTTQKLLAVTVANVIILMRVGVSCTLDLEVAIFEGSTALTIRSPDWSSRFYADVRLIDHAAMLKLNRELTSQ